MTRRTSAAVYHQIESEGLLSRVRFLVYEILYHRGPLTAAEVWQRTGESRVTISPRFAELLDRGVIYEVRERRCAVTGREVIEWDVTSNLPVESSKEKALTKREVIEKYDLLVVEIIDWLESQKGDIRKVTVVDAARKLSERRAQIIPKEGEKETNGTAKSGATTEGATTEGATTKTSQ